MEVERDRLYSSKPSERNSMPYAKSKSPPDTEKLGKPEVNLIQDFFGYYYNEDGTCCRIKRFTWTNNNKIQVQVINYGARIISMKYPDRRGDVDDVVLGFDDLAGYIFYKKYYFGATIGRMTNCVKKGTFKIQKKEYFLTPNTKTGHHTNGGSEGFDQVVWKTYVKGKKVIMSHMSPSGEHGYPGNLLVRISFELSTRNEFSVSMEAFTSEPTIVNLSNLLYINLAGHHSGANGLYKHVININCNCFTKQDDDGYCTGEIMNVAHTRFDFQTPKVLGKYIGLVPNDGFDQNLCINKGCDQEETFVARLAHYPSGRMLEIYSNQYGVQFNTANHFGFGHRISTDQILKLPAPTIKTLAPAFTEPEDISLRIIDYLHAKMLIELREEEETYYAGFREFIQILKKFAYKNTPLNVTQGLGANTMTSGLRSSLAKRTSSMRPSKLSLGKTSVSFEDDLRFFTCTPKQMTYLQTLQEVLMGECFDESANWLVSVIEKLIYYSTKNAEKTTLKPATKRLSNVSGSAQSTKTEESNHIPASFSVAEPSERSFSEIEKPVLEKPTAANASAEKLVSEVRESHVSYKKQDTSNGLVEEKPANISEQINKNIPTKLPQVPPKRNVIPSYYKSCDEIIGKERKLYKMHGGVALQTQNYPNCANFDNFPKCVLLPGEKYKNTIIYKFWIRPGNPKRWMKRNKFEVYNNWTKKNSEARE